MPSGVGYQLKGSHLALDARRRWKLSLLCGRSEVLLKLRETLVARERELTDVKKKLTELEAMHAQTNRELVTAKSDCMPILFSLFPPVLALFCTLVD